MKEKSFRWLAFLGGSILLINPSGAIAQTCDTSKIIVNVGWNMISFPLNVPNGDKNVLFPTATSDAYAYQNSYTKRNTLFPGVGYWLKFAAPQTIMILGDLVNNVSVKPRWNMIGSLAWTIPVNELIVTPDSNIISPYYTYIPGVGYRIADTLETGRGYWVKAKHEGKVMPPIPQIPELLFPGTGVGDQPLTISFKWRKAKYGSTYHIEVATDIEFTEIVADDSTLNDTTYLLNGLECNRTYYWRVESKNVTGTSGWPTSYIFMTASYLPINIAPQLILPPDNTENQFPKVPVQWNAVQGAAYYHVQIATDSLFANLCVDDSIYIDTAQIQCLQYSSKYYWRARGWNNCESSGWSTIWKFSTCSIPESLGWEYLGFAASIEGIAVQDSNTVYAVTLGGYYHTGNIFKTTNAGACWQALLPYTASYLDIKMNPNNHDILYAALGGHIDPPYGILKTTDAGTSWFFVNSGLTVNWETYIQDIEFDPLNSETLYAGTGGAYGGKMYKTTNGGNNWFSITTNDTLRTGVRTIAIHPETTSIVYVGTNEGFLMKTTDGGSSWSATLLDYGGAVMGTAIDPSDPQLIYAGITRFGGGLKESTDGGVTWNIANIGLPSQSGAGNLAINPFTHTVWTNIVNPQVDSAGIFQSTNFGEYWMRTEGLPSGNRDANPTFSPDATLLYIGFVDAGIYRKIIK